MTRDDIRRIFQCDDIISVGIAMVPVDYFLDTLGFSLVEPTKEAMLTHDGGKMGYAQFIESGNWEVVE